ncbi:MAG: hypothetical protein HZB68_05860, partial [Candidatus Aenigmarchaeota archaeon]|nr:hypothetical protein [Candidatus Aenigmarchaeota archaeon]
MVRETWFESVSRGGRKESRITTRANKHIKIRVKRDFLDLAEEIRRYPEYFVGSEDVWVSSVYLDCGNEFAFF